MLKKFAPNFVHDVFLKIKRHELHKSKNAGKVHLLSQVKNSSPGEYPYSHLHSNWLRVGARF